MGSRFTMQFDGNTQEAIPRPSGNHVHRISRKSIHRRSENRSADKSSLGPVDAKNTEQYTSDLLRFDGAIQIARTRDQLARRYTDMICADALEHIYWINKFEDEIDKHLEAI
ncbi:hypothetical protein GJ496_010648 [Pomphorhynchus laevis]|nr:hypothetical protein GJ496_010648 [Pomphorhynchus laevis]